MAATGSAPAIRQIQECIINHAKRSEVATNGAQLYVSRDFVTGRSFHGASAVAVAMSREAKVSFQELYLYSERSSHSHS